MLDWKLATAFPESYFSLSPTLYSSFCPQQRTLLTFILTHYKHINWIKDMEKREVKKKKVWQPGRMKAGGSVGPREPKLACEWKGETASGHHPVVQGQTRDRAWPQRETRHRAGAPRARELGSCEHTQETQIDRHKNPETGRAVQASWSLTGLFCAWLAFSSSSLPPVPGYNRLVFQGSAQTPSAAESPPARPQRIDPCPAALHPARACPCC